MNHIPTVIIREARESEAEIIAGVLLASYQQYASVMEPEAWNSYRLSIAHSVHGSGPHARLVADLDGEIVGSALLFMSSEAAYGNPDMGLESPIIRLLAVAPSARGLGIAKLLIEEAARRAEELGFTTLNLHTSDMMASAIKLYEKLGFERHDETDTFNGETHVKGYRLKLPGIRRLQNVN